MHPSIYLWCCARRFARVSMWTCSNSDAHTGLKTMAVFIFSVRGASTVWISEKARPSSWESDGSKCRHSLNPLVALVSKWMHGHTSFFVMTLLFNFESFLSDFIFRPWQDRTCACGFPSTSTSTDALLVIRFFDRGYLTVFIRPNFTNVFRLIFRFTAASEMKRIDWRNGMRATVTVQRC